MIPTNSVSRSTLEQPDINLGLRSQHAIGAIRELHGLLSRSAAVTAPATLWRAFEERLVLGVNRVARNVAIPHARTPAVTTLTYAIGRSAAGISVGPDSELVRLMFLVAAPTGHVIEYLEFMARLTRMLRREAVKRDLIAAPSEAEFRAILAREFFGK